MHDCTNVGPFLVVGSKQIVQGYKEYDLGNENYINKLGPAITE